MVEIKLLLHILEQSVLDDKYKFSVYVLESPYLMMKLNQDGLCRHLPIYPTGLALVLRIHLSSNSKASKRSLPKPESTEGVGNKEVLKG